MPNDTHAKIAGQNWTDFEKSLLGATSKRAGSSQEQDLRAYFGDEEFAVLQRLAARGDARRRTRAPLKGNVVFLPGIMGSTLATREKDGDEDTVWVNFVRLVAGRLQRLKLTPDGTREEDSKYQVFANGLDKRSYSRALLWLRARWNTEPFPYDWRKDLDGLADDLARFIKDKFKGAPVHLVAHSMGGLVSRNFIRRHAELWNQMRDSDGQGGRLIMLGTPNYGSFTIPQVLTGAERLLRLLAAADLSHDLNEVLEIVDSFVGSYLMLPAPAKIPPETRDLYRRDTWGSFPVSELHLRRAMKFHQDLEPVVDPARMIYVAGYGQETIAGLRVNAPGEFEYTVTHAGDGRVPHALGFLPGVTNYFIEESHGDLARNETVLGAVEELLDQGRTSVLPEQLPVIRAMTPEGAKWRRSIGDMAIQAELSQIARRGDRATPDELRTAEETLLAAVVGQEHTVRKMVAASEAKRREQARPRIKLKIEVLCGDITRVAAPVVVVGHYRGVKPINAVGALDRALGGWITKAGEAGMIGGGLGELFFIPVPPGCVAAKAVVLAGMGEVGHFNREDLRYLFVNVTTGAAGLGTDHFATVLVGGGKGGLPADRAVRAMIVGIGEALTRLPKSQHLKQVTLIEREPDVHKKILEAVTAFAVGRVSQDLELEVTSRALPAEPIRKRPDESRERSGPAQDPIGPRITIERSGDVFRFAAMTPDAVVPVREVRVQTAFAEGVAERLMKSDGRQEQEQYGRLLHTYLMPEDFQGLLGEPLTLILDRGTASFPWEMACYGRSGRSQFYGPHLRLTRQFRTMLSGAPGMAPPLKRALRVLVVADPAPDREYQLPGARAEGRAVVQVLREFDGRDGLELEVVDRIGAGECDPVEILALILSGDFDVIHYAGHGLFDVQKPDLSGWMFGKELILSAREIFRARQVPRLVFANACFSAVVRPGQAFSAEESNRQLAGLAEAFFERGVPNYLGSGWPVGDLEAVRFATEFYRKALSGEVLSTAIAAGREAILHQGSTWGAYQHYGQAGSRLVAAKPLTYC